MSKAGSTAASEQLLGYAMSIYLAQGHACIVLRWTQLTRRSRLALLATAAADDAAAARAALRGFVGKPFICRRKTVDQAQGQ